MIFRKKIKRTNAAPRREYHLDRYCPHHDRIPSCLRLKHPVRSGRCRDHPVR
jgi:hypothetical protein